MTDLWPGDELVGDDGETFKLGRQLAYQGCESPSMMCSQHSGRCVQWHCSTCDKPVSSQGHDCPKLKEYSA
jgi:hypothetical protein